MTRRYVYIISALLAGISLATFIYKWQVLGFPVTRDQQQPVWTIETSIRFEAGPGSIKVHLQIPTLTPGFRTLREFNVSKGYGFSVNYVSGGREAQWAVRRTGGRQTLYYRRVVYEDPASEQIDTTPPFPPPPVINEPLRTAVEVIVADVRDRSADTASFTTELLRRFNDPSPSSNIELLLADANTSAQFVETVTTVLAAARIPARLIRGVILQDQQRRVDPTPWLEVHDGDRWRYFNPNNGAEELPERYLIGWRGNQPVGRVEGGSNGEVNFAVQKNFLDSMSIVERRAQVEGSLLVDFSLFSLPIQTQAVYSVLLMIPIGALIMVVMRNIIGIDAFGTFMPVLIALSFRETQLLWGTAEVRVGHHCEMESTSMEPIGQLASIRLHISWAGCVGTAYYLARSRRGPARLRIRTRRLLRRESLHTTMAIAPGNRGSRHGLAVLSAQRHRSQNENCENMVSVHNGRVAPRRWEIHGARDRAQGSPARLSCRCSKPSFW